MAKIPVKPVVKLVKNNWKTIVKGATVIAPLGKGAVDYFKEREQTKQEKGKVPYRKTRFIKYNTEILNDLDSKNRMDLFKYTVEIKQFIEQIKGEEDRNSVVKKPLFTKWINNWNDIHIQIEDKIRAKDYQEFLMIYNNRGFNSSYFEGFESNLQKFIELIEKGNNEELYTFIHSFTNRGIEEIKRDFSF